VGDGPQQLAQGLDHARQLHRDGLVPAELVEGLQVTLQQPVQRREGPDAIAFEGPSRRA